MNVWFWLLVVVPVGLTILFGVCYLIGVSSLHAQWLPPLVDPAENAFPLRYRSPLLDRPPNPDLDIVYSHLGKSVRREYCIIQDVAVIERLRQNGYTCKPTHADWYETNFSVEKNGLHVLPSGQTLYVRGTQLLLSAEVSPLTMAERCECQDCLKRKFDKRHQEIEPAEGRIVSTSSIPIGEPPAALILNPGGQSNRALIALMKKIDGDIAQCQGSELNTLQACKEEMLHSPADWRQS